MPTLISIHKSQSRNSYIDQFTCNATNENIRTAQQTVGIKECWSIPDQVNHLSFDDYVTIDDKGKLKNGIQPAACICKQLNNFAYFLVATLSVFTVGMLGYFCSFMSSLVNKITQNF